MARTVAPVVLAGGNNRDSPCSIRHVAEPQRASIDSTPRPATGTHRSYVRSSRARNFVIVSGDAPSTLENGPFSISVSAQST